MTINVSRFENLTKYLPLLDEDTFGTWVIDRENDGTIEYPVQMPFVNYSEMVHHFIDDVHEFSGNNSDFELTRYGDVLDQNGLERGSKSMSEAEISKLGAKCAMALIMGAVRAE